MSTGNISLADEAVGRDTLRDPAVEREDHIMVGIGAMGFLNVFNPAQFPFYASAPLLLVSRVLTYFWYM